MMNKLSLLPDWQQLVKKAWSIRLMTLAFLLTAVEVILPFFNEDLPRNLFATLSGISVAGAFIARLLVQQEANK